MSNNELTKEVTEAMRTIGPGKPRLLADRLRAIWASGELKSTSLVKKEQREAQEHLGVAHDTLRDIGMAAGKDAASDADAFIALSCLLWNEYGREGRLVAVYILGNLSLSVPEKIFPLCRRLAVSCASWEDSDNLVYGIEPAVRCAPDKHFKALAEWAEDENKWVKRIAVTVLGRLATKKAEYTQMCLEATLPCLEEDDPDVRRAASFAIRLCARGNLAAVREFIHKNAYGQNKARVWIFSDVMRSMTKSFLKDFLPLLPLYRQWLASLEDGRSRASLEAAVKVMEGAQ